MASTASTPTVIETNTGTVGESSDYYLAVGGQRVRVRYREGVGIPIVLCNGIGASLEVLDPLVENLDPTRPVVRFDVPGTGESPPSLAPYGFPYLAWVLGKILDRLEIEVVDVLGLSWGGALAQQFAFQNPRRCRRLILVGTGTGVLMVPGSPKVLSKMLTPKRFSDPSYGATIAADLYGGKVRDSSQQVAELFVRQLHAGSAKGYVHQLMAGSVWTSLFALPAIRQKTLIIAGTDDPIIPVINAKIMNTLLPRATLHEHDGGHIDLMVNAVVFGPVIDSFLGPTKPYRRKWSKTADVKFTPGG
ncbi:alpha/beta fold hydrolase [Gordonia sp. (in: high G+C Gram-positive bacteria)]|uniref:alpha/beta fold hydrolase n=1 Tax=Gordonia sp. (in: high G+C Gram-positive bacteria) TaxID=84139 RepID=UPI001694FEFA|nr:alpha/beta fold hydrolase [Gordonia sp. (in: high G+C Gram-positive bacteria)]NLG48380.1 alpha/beta fold hydrolase [Gordonia sp. (in: high G+C Gram-positive bacteria)]